MRWPTFDELFTAESQGLGVEVRGKDVLPLLSGDLRPRWWKRFVA